MKEKDLKRALDAEIRLVSRLIKHPEEFDELPRKSVVIPELNLTIPVKSWKEADKIMSRKFTLERLVKIKSHELALGKRKELKN